MQEVDGVLVAAGELKRPLLELRQLAFGFDGSGPEDEKIRTEMVSVAERAMRQVNDLAKIRQLQNGLFEMEPVAVRAVCDDVVAELSRVLQDKRPKMKVRYSNRSKLAVANQELLRSVVYNFLLNAVHYNSDDLKAELKVFEKDAKIEIAVRDFGPALPSNFWRELKNSELRQPEDIAMRPGSSALGLYIASKFSSYMHAEVGTVRHRDGTSFFIKLPVSRQLSLWEME